MRLCSACLLGIACRYDGQSVADKRVLALAAVETLIPVCPEQLGGLPTPRPAAEIQQDGRVMTGEGKDVTSAFLKGAEQALALCQQQKIKYALLKESSPSCGSHDIYDGQFRGRKIQGEGITAHLLKAHGIRIFSEQQIDELFTTLS